MKSLASLMQAAEVNRISPRRGRRRVAAEEQGLIRSVPPPRSAAPGPNAPVAVAEVQPFSPAELKGACMRPYWIIEYVLANKERLMKNIEDDQRLTLLAALLFLSGVLFAIPYGVVRPTGSFWKIATLYTGSLLICFPSLYVFNQYYGSRLKLRQSLAVSLIISSVAAMFALGFAPIIWFIDFTTKPTATTEITPHRLSVFLLAVSFALGVIHMARCLASDRLPARTNCPCAAGFVGMPPGVHHVPNGLCCWSCSRDEARGTSHRGVGRVRLLDRVRPQHAARRLQPR